MKKNTGDSGEKYKIVLTGGHAATVAVAVAEKLKSSKFDWDVHWIGVKRAIEGKPVVTLESRVLPKLGVKCHNIVAGRIQKKFSIWTIPSFLKIPLGFVSAFRLIWQIKPSVVLSFGGFAAFPVVVSSWILRRKVIIHEQTMTAGRANIASAPFATLIALARENSKKYFDNKKVRVVGNPLMDGIIQISHKASIGVPPTIFITAGSRGSLFINKLIRDLVAKLLENYKVIHQTGELDYENFIKYRNSLINKNNYQVFSTIDPLKMPEMYKNADIVVARSGANTVAEIISLKIPTVFIPLPHTYKNEQIKNAKFAKKMGVGRVLMQDEASPDNLFEEIKFLEKNWVDIKKKTKNYQNMDSNASGKVVEILEECVEKI